MSFWNKVMDDWFGIDPGTDRAEWWMTGSETKFGEATGDTARSEEHRLKRAAEDKIAQGNKDVLIAIEREQEELRNMSRRAAQAVKDERRRAVRRKGRSSTILTSFNSDLGNTSVGARSTTGA